MNVHKVVSHHVNNTIPPPPKNKHEKNKYLYITISAVVMILGFMLNKYIHKSADHSTTSPSVNEMPVTPSKAEVQNTCSICNRSFTGNGYEEVSDGVWRMCQDPYQCPVCSKACGMKHTREMNKYLNQSNNTNDGRIYESNACSLCKGTGIEKSTAPNLTGEYGRVCPMCDGKGVRGY
jgi:hypothetical protein